MQMVFFVVLVSAFVGGTISAHWIDSAKQKLAIAGLLLAPLLMVVLSFWYGSRSGCAGGGCGPAIMLLGLIGLVALPFAVAGIAFIVQLSLMKVTGLFAARRVGERTISSTATALSLLLVAAIVMSAWYGLKAQPSAACRDRHHVILIEGARLRLPFGAETTLSGVEPGDGTFALINLRSARAFCARSTSIDHPLDVKTIIFDNSGWRDRWSALDTGLVTRFLFGDDAQLNRATICDGVMRRVARPLFCSPSVTMHAGSLEYRRKMTLEAATKPMLKDLLERSASEPTSPVFVREWSGPERTTSGRFTMDRLDQAWIIRAGAVSDDPLGYPQTLVYCHHRPNGMLRCQIRQRLTRRLAAYTIVSFDKAIDVWVVLPIIDRSDAFLRAMLAPNDT